MSGRTQLHRAESLSRSEYEDIQEVGLAAWSDLPNVDEETARDIVRWGDLDGFIKARADPNSLVGDRHHENQSYSRPRIVVHTNENERPDGYLYVVNNVSGTEKDQRNKRFSVVYNYLKIDEVAVRPEAQGNGVARKVTARALITSYQIQPVSTYIWPEYTPDLQESLQRYGFRETGSEDYEIYDGGPETTQVRMQARSAFELLWQLTKSGRTKSG